MDSSPPGARASAVTVRKQLRRRLARMPDGARLPPERRLSAELACSRETLRRALLELEKSGLVWRRVGQGTFAGPRPSGEPFRPAILFEQASPAELMAARLVIEPAVAAEAARRAARDDIDMLRDLARRTADAVDWRSYEAADEAFHRAIAVVTDNRLLMAILGLLSTVRGRSRWRRQHDRAFRAANNTAYSRSQGKLHLAVVQAIADGDAEGAERAMRHHLGQISELMNRKE